MKTWLFVLLMFFIGHTGLVQAQDDIDTAIVAQIRDQAFKHSQVMDIAFHLTDASGPRLSNSSGLARAQQWAVGALRQWGLVHVGLESWGTFGRGWEVQKMYLALKQPYYQAMVGYPGAWTQGSGGPFVTQVVLYQPKDSTEQAALRGTLKGKMLLLPRADPMFVSFDPVASRYADSDLEKMVNPPVYILPKRNVSAQAAKPKPTPPAHTPRPRRPRMKSLEAFCAEEGVLGILDSGPNDKNGTVFVGAAGPRELTQPLGPMRVTLMFEDHQRLQRLLENGIPVMVEGDVQCRSVETDSLGYNVIGEIPGTDEGLKSQVVMLGAHLDSWTAATGATDNGAGSTVMLEVVRILQAIHIQPRRTIRIALWSGEEQGLLGSHAYVQKHFVKGDISISAYYNLDNGTGRVRGIYLQEDTAAGPIFRQWLQPFSDLGATTVTLQNTGGTDHNSFNNMGIPGFQFIQDPIEYYTRTHHSNMDSYDHLLPADLQQAACIIAAFVYETAMRAAIIPRRN